MNEHRINARVDAATQRRIDELTLTTGQSVSHVVREAIAAYHVQVLEPRAPSRFLRRLGTGRSGRDDTASDTRRALSQSLAAKHDLAPMRKRRS
jgi:predicted DNA-binding protein